MDQDDGAPWRSTWGRPVGVLVADDQEPFRAAVRELVPATSGFVLVGEVESGEAAVQAADELRPDLVIIDKRMPGLGGIEACRLITARHPHLVAVITSVEDPDPSLKQTAGAAAFVRKQEISRRLLREVWRDHAPGQVPDR
jgi:DNA-binding NarL/FixJ family response regulator